MSGSLQQMIRDIEREVAYTRHMIGRDRLDPVVMAAMQTVAREEFVPEEMKKYAFDNGPLSIGHGQTISQPFIVALMTDLLAVQPHDQILEIGTGSGYQTAILCQLCKKVYTVEVVRGLSHTAQQRLAKLGYENIESRIANGYNGWAEYAPYDGIIVTAAAEYIPPALIEQLSPGGKLVIPVGHPYSYQELVLIDKDDEGNLHQRNILGVAFVPLVDTEAVD